jgi:succinate dehydrogenase / fumarate reductase membrane anchor subunit
MSDFQTPLSRVRYLGSAHNGTKHFWHQRLTSLAAIPLLIAFIFILLKLVNAPYDQALLIIRDPFNLSITALFVFISAWHMKLGMQVIIEDYIHGEALKFIFLIANNLFSALVGFVSLLALLRLGMSL